MDLPFIALLFFIVGIFVSSLLLFVYAKRLTETFIRKNPIASTQKIRILRLCAFMGVVICFGLAAFLLPRTMYGKHLLGQYYFSEYLRNSSSPTASKAFRLWQQAHDKPAFQQAFVHIPQDSELWKEFLHRTAPLYLDEKNPNAYVQYLEDLAKKVTHPVAVSAVNLELGTAFFEVDPAIASGYFRVVLELKSDPESMDRARGNLHELENLNIGQESPGFHLTTIENTKIAGPDLLGKVVLLQFWSRNCPHCVAEFPTLKRIHGLFRPEDFVMVGISLDNGPEVIQFIKENNLPSPQVTITSATSPELIEGFNIQYIPTNYIIGRDGKIAFKKLRGKQLEKALQSLLAK